MTRGIVLWLGTFVAALGGAWWATGVLWPGTVWPWCAGGLVVLLWFLGFVFYQVNQPPPGDGPQR